MIEAKAASGATLTKQQDGSILAGGASAETDTYTIICKTNVSGVTALRLEALTDPSLGGMGPGRTPHGNFVLTGFRASAAEKPVAFRSAVADFEQKENRPFDFTAKAALANRPTTGWAIAPQMGRQHLAVFETEHDLVAGRLTVTLDQQYGGKHTLGKFRLAATTAARPVQPGTLPDRIGAIVAIHGEKRSVPQQQELMSFYRSIAPELAGRRGQLAGLRKQEAAIQPATTLVMQELPQPRPTHVQIRGNHKNLGDLVQPGVPAKLHALPKSSAPARLALRGGWSIRPIRWLAA